MQNIKRVLKLSTWGIAMSLVVGAMCYFLGKQLYVTNWSESLCRTNDKGQSYCRYKGALDGLYSNSDGLVLVYFKTPFDLGEAKAKGYPILNGQAGAIPMADPDKREILSQLKLAYVNKRPVEIHLRDVSNGFLVVDRVWLK